MSICSHCVVTHARQGKTKAHVLSEISSVLKAQEDLEHKLALVRETSMEQTRRRTAEEEKIEREKQMVESGHVQFLTRQLEQAEQAKKGVEAKLKEAEHKRTKREEEMAEEVKRTEKALNEERAAMERAIDIPTMVPWFFRLSI